MKYLRPKKKGYKIRISGQREIIIPMYCVVEVDEKSTGAIVKIKALTGTEMDYGGTLTDTVGYFVKKRYVDDMLNNKHKFLVSDHFNFIEIK